MKPEIILPYDPGRLNADLAKSRSRLTATRSFKDQSTVIVVPTRGGRSLCPRFVSAITGLMRPMNQMCYGPVFLSGMEVGDAFNSAVEMILAHPQLSRFKYLLTVEDDNLPPPDGLLKLLESIEDHAAVGGLYWTKGECGQPMIYGDPNITPINFIPQLPRENSIQRCNGLGMGFTLFRMSALAKMERPLFVTKQSWDPAVGAKSYTQDLYAFEKMAKAGLKVACDTRVKVAHLDIENDIAW